MGHICSVYVYGQGTCTRKKVIQQSFSFKRWSHKTVKTAISLLALFIRRFSRHSSLHHIIYNMSENHPECISEVSNCSVKFYYGKNTNILQVTVVHISLMCINYSIAQSMMWTISFPFRHGIWPRLTTAVSWEVSTNFE